MLFVTKDVKKLRHSISSKGGTTEAAIQLFEDKNFKEIINQKDNFFKLIDLAFVSRRKNIKNNLKSLSINWNEVDIDPTKRPEEISLDDYLLLSKVLVL